MQATDIKQLIESHLNQCQALVEGNDGVHFSATVISPDFQGKNRIQRQQMIYAALGNRIIDGTIHALTLKAVTPDEWSQTL